MPGGATQVTANDQAVTNAGTARARPIFRIYGPGRLRQIRNYTTDKVIHFDLLLLTGEIAALDLSDPTQIVFSSNFRTSLLDQILPGSSLDFYLEPGDNVIAAFIGSESGGTTKIYAYWRTAHHSLDAARSVGLLGD